MVNRIGIYGSKVAEGLSAFQRRSCYMSSRGLMGKLTVDQIMQDKNYDTKFIQCVDKSSYVVAGRKPSCLNSFDQIFPKDIWELNDGFGKLARRVFYGTEEILRPTQNFTELAPNIAHLVWIGGGPMDYLFYLCVLSLLYVVQVDTLYIHGDGPPSGQYWDSIRNHSRLKSIYREPGMVYGNRIGVKAHMSDVWRADFMVKYGGIYCDTGKWTWSYGGWHVNDMLMAAMARFRWVETRLNSSPPGQNGRLFEDGVFRWLLLNEKFCILIEFRWSLSLRVQLTINQHWFM